MKKVLTAILVLSLMMALVICAPAASAEGPKAKIGFIVMDYANPYFVTLAEGFKARAEELGIDYMISDATWMSY